MLKKLIYILLLFILTPLVTYCADLGNSIDFKEYPNYEKVEPHTNFNGDPIISGSVSKDIEMNLDNCIRIALGNNPEINAAFQDILAADARIKQVWSNFFPTFSWQTSYTHIKQLQLSDALGTNLQYDYYLLGQISLQQMLYDFGVTQNQATIRKLDYEGYKKTFEAIVNDVIFQTKDAYYNLLYAYENVQVANDTVKKFTAFYDQARAFYKSGMNPKVDVTIAQSDLSDAKLSLIQAKNGVNLAIAQLNHVMGVPYLEKYKINDKLSFSPVNLSFEQAVSIARDSRPELKLAEIKVENARQNVQLMKKSFFPTLSIEGQYQRGGKHWTSNDGFNIGGFLIFPGINAALIRNQIKEARYLYDKELANARITQNEIYLEIQNAYLKLEEKRDQLPVAELQIKQANENYHLSFGRYKVGEASPIELKNAQTTYEDAKLIYYNALYEYNSAKAQLEKAIGKNIINDCDKIDLKK
ncbi:TolC family protein [bacterium]|nr:TolC family protein [bacterium]